MDLSLNKKLQKIDEKAFYNNKIKSLSLPTAIKEINYSAFGYNLIENILLPRSLEYIGDFCFVNNMIKEVYIEYDESLLANNKNLWLLVNKFYDPINTAFSNQTDHNNIKIKTEIKAI